MKRIGEADRLVIFKSPTEAVDKAGQRVRSYTEFYRCRAKVINLQGAEQIQADQQTSLEPIAWQIRYYPGINTAMIVEYEGQEYNITAVTEAQKKEKFYRKRWLQIRANTTDADTSHQF